MLELDLMAPTRPATDFRLRCLGPAQVIGPGAARVAFQTRKHLVLVLYLARQPGRPVSRDALTDLFWHGDEERKARHSLSQAVSLINKSLGTEAIGPAGTNRLALREDLFSVDVAEFERLVADGQYVEARTLWGGRLLEGYWVPRAPRLEEWIGEERTRLDRVYRRVLHELIEEHRAAGDHEAMRRDAEALLEMDELDEKAMLGYLESLTLLGDRTLALRRYGEFEKRIERELEAEPSAELRGWARRQRRGTSDAATHPSIRHSSSPALPPAQPLFGRSSEFRVLWEYWERARSGRGHSVVISGEAGIGKTALLLKLLNQVHVSGGSVCYVRCYPSERAIPFAPVTSLVRQLTRLQGFVATSAVWLGELTRLVPELRERYTTIPEPMAPDDSARHRLVDATVHAAEAVAEEQPLLIGIDDVQDADEASLALTHYLGRQVERMPILMVSSRRSTSLAVQEDAALKGRRLGSAMMLDRLPAPELAQLVRQVLARGGLQASDGQIDELVGHAAGNPLHAIESTIGLTSGAAISTPVSRRPRPVTTTGFEESAAQRFRQLPATAQEIATVLATAGRPLSEYEIARLTRRGPAELAYGMATLEEALFAKRVGSDFGIAHERYCETIRASLTERERRVLHLRLARMHATSAANNGAAHYEVAKHFEAAGRFAEAATYGTAAARFAESIGAVRSCATALELVARVTDPDENLLTELGACYLGLNDLDALDELCATSRARLTRTGAMQAELDYLAIAAATQRGSTPLVDLERQLELVVSRGAFKHLPQAELLLIQTADKTGNYATVRRAVRRMRRRPDAEKDPAYLHFAIGYTIAKYYWPAKALPHLLAALEACQRKRDWMLEQYCRDCIGITLKNMGRYRESIAHFDHSLALARKVMSPQAEARSLQNRAVSEMALGELEAAWRTLGEVGDLEIGGLFGDYTTFNKGVILFIRGDYEAALQVFLHTLEITSRRQHALLAGDACAFAALTFQRLGRFDEMATMVAQLPAVEPADRSMRIGFVTHAALAWNRALVVGEPEEAIDDLSSWGRKVARRDVALWLAIEWELVLLRETTSLARDAVGRARLIDLARHYQAAAIERAALGASPT